jgi:hypothetical protein
MEPRLRADFWISALLRRIETAGAQGVVVRKGDATGGAVVLKHNRFAEGCRVYAQVRDGTGRAAWMAATGASPVDEAAADAYIERQVRFDADLWVVEIEDPRSRWTMDEPLV